MMYEYNLKVKIKNKIPIDPNEAGQLVMEFLEVEWHLDKVIVEIEGSNKIIIGGNES